MPERAGVLTSSAPWPRSRRISRSGRSSCAPARAGRGPWRSRPGEPPPLREPPAHRPDRWDVRGEAGVLCAQIVDHATGRLTFREPTLRLPSQVRPRVRAWLRALRSGTDAAEMRGQRGLMALRPDARRPPHRMKAGDEVPTRPASLKLVAAVRCTEPHRNPVSQIVLRPGPVTCAPADRAHRQLPDPLSLVEALCHTLIIPHEPVTPLPRTVPPAYQL
jgi:hypothetical protein